MNKSVFTVYIKEPTTGHKLYLKYPGSKPEITFANNGGYKWTSKSKAEQYCVDNDEIVKCFVEEFDMKNYNNILTTENVMRWTESKGFIAGRTKRGKVVEEVKEEIIENTFFEEKTFTEKVEEATKIDPELEEDEVKSFHPVCVKCSRRCKQNPIATIHSCPIFNKAA